MNRFIRETSMMASLLVLVAGLWQDWGTLVTLKRMLVTYLCFFGLGAVMALVVHAARTTQGPAGRQTHRQGAVERDD